MLQGIEQRRSGEDALAVQLFNDALALRPDSARAKVHLGTAHHALGDWLAADLFLREALASRDDPYVTRHRSELEQELEVVAGHLGELRVEADVEGAQVRLNGRVVATTPVRQPVRVEVGSYRMEVERTGFVPAVRDVSIAARRESRVSVALQPLAGDARPLWAPRWVPWTLGGLGAVGVLTASTALYEREKYARRWNDCFDRQPEGGNSNLTRQALCGQERDNVRTAESVLLWSGAVSGALLAGAVVSGLVRQSAPQESAEGSARLACGVGLGTVVCSGSF